MSPGAHDTPLPVQPEQRIGRVLAGHYRLASVLGAGAAGVVYSATDVRDGTPLAIKVLTAHDDMPGQALRRFQREGAALQKLNHRNVVRVFDAGTDTAADQPLAYIAMECLQGETLAERIERQGGPLPPALCGHVATEVLAALAYAHDMQVVHRDLKPSNIFLAGDPRRFGARPDARPAVKLLDFGLAKFLAVEPSDVSQTLTRSGMVLGTPLYMAPEQCAGDRVDARADVYAAGCLLFEMLTGEPPFLGESHADVVRAHLVTPVPPLPGDAEDGTRTALSQVVAKAMSKQPEDRYEDAAEMQRALRAAGGAGTRGQAQRARQMLGVLGRGRARLPQGRRLGWLLAAVVAGLLALAQQALHPHLAGTDAAPSIAQPVDLWTLQGVPPELAAIHTRVTAGKGVSQRDLASVRSYARKHRGDARPFLLLARGFLNQGWRKDAIVRYRRAAEVDPRALAHGPMLRDLIDIAEGDKYAAEASAAIVELYGRDALATVSAAMNGRPRDSSEHARLAQLVKLLERAPVERAPATGRGAAAATGTGT